MPKAKSSPRPVPSIPMRVALMMPPMTPTPARCRMVSGILSGGFTAVACGGVAVCVVMIPRYGRADRADTEEPGHLGSGFPYPRAPFGSSLRSSLRNRSLSERRTTEGRMPQHPPLHENRSVRHEADEQAAGDLHREVVDPRDHGAEHREDDEVEDRHDGSEGHHLR